MADLQTILGTIFGSGEGSLSLGSPAAYLRKKMVGRNDPTKFEGGDLLQLLLGVLTDPLALGAGVGAAVGGPMLRNAVNRGFNRRLGKSLKTHITPSQMVDESALGRLLLREPERRGGLTEPMRDLIPEGGIAGQLNDPVGGVGWEGIGASPQSEMTRYGVGSQYRASSVPSLVLKKNQFGEDVPVNTDLSTVMGLGGKDLFGEDLRRNAALRELGEGMDISPSMQPSNLQEAAKSGGSVVGMSTVPRGGLLDLAGPNRHSGGQSGLEWLKGLERESRDEAETLLGTRLRSGGGDAIRREQVGYRAEEPIHMLSPPADNQRIQWEGSGRPPASSAEDRYSIEEGYSGNPTPYRMGTNPEGLSSALIRSGGSSVGRLGELESALSETTGALTKHLRRGSELDLGSQLGKGPEYLEPSLEDSSGGLSRWLAEENRLSGGGTIDSPLSPSPGSTEWGEMATEAVPRQPTSAFGLNELSSAKIPSSELPRLESLLTALRDSDMSDESLSRALAKVNKKYPTASTLKGLLVDLQRTSGPLMSPGRTAGMADAGRLSALYEAEAAGRISPIGVEEMLPRIVKKGSLKSTGPEGTTPDAMATSRMEDSRRDTIKGGRSALKIGEWGQLSATDQTRYLRNSILLGGRRRGDQETGFGLELRSHKKSAEIRRVLRDSPDVTMAEEAAQSGERLVNEAGTERGEYLGMEDIGSEAEGMAIRRNRPSQLQRPSTGHTKPDPVVSKPSLGSLLGREGGAVAQSGGEVQAAMTELHGFMSSPGVGGTLLGTVKGMPSPQVGREASILAAQAAEEAGSDWELFELMKKATEVTGPLRGALAPPGAKSVAKLLDSNYLEDIVRAVENQYASWERAGGRRKMPGREGRRAGGIKIAADQSPELFERQLEFVKYLDKAEQHRVVKSLGKISRQARMRLAGILADHQDMLTRTSHGLSANAESSYRGLVPTSYPIAGATKQLTTKSNKGDLAIAIARNRKQMADYLEKNIEGIGKRGSLSDDVVGLESKRILQEKLKSAGYSAIRDEDLITLLRSGDLVSPNIGRRTNYRMSPIYGAFGAAPGGARGLLEQLQSEESR